MPTVSERTPEQYRKTIQDFLMAYFNRRKWEIEQTVLGVQVPLVQSDLLYNSALADQLCDIARAAAGEMEHTEDDWTEGVLYEGIQDLMERLFAPPGLTTAYDIPARFWDTDLGQMMARAFIWLQRDELITITEAAEMRGVSIQAISNAVAAGRLRKIVNPDEPNPQRRTLVSKRDVEALS